MECYQCHGATNRNQQFISRVSRMSVRADLAARFNGVEQALAWPLVALVNVAVLTLAWTALRLRSQPMEVARQQKTA